MTTVAAALNRIARQCGVTAPTSWVSATRTDHVELRDDFLDETIEDIKDRVDLASPLGKQTTITGDDSTNYSLPANFHRLQRDELAVYDVSQDRPCVPVPTDGAWSYMTDIGTSGVAKFYRLKGYEGTYTLDLYSAPTSSQTYTVSYVSTVWMKSSGGTEGSAFTADDDVLLLPRRVVEAGTVARYRERRGLPYDDKWNEYEALMSRLSTDRKQIKTISFAPPDEKVRWQDLVPSFIPSS